jgi:hypothetical protein
MPAARKAWASKAALTSWDEAAVKLRQGWDEEVGQLQKALCSGSCMEAFKTRWTSWRAVNPSGTCGQGCTGRQALARHGVGEGEGCGACGPMKPETSVLFACGVDGSSLGASTSRPQYGIITRVAAIPEAVSNRKQLFIGCLNTKVFQIHPLSSPFPSQLAAAAGESLFTG